jgi:hypothetical protein
MKKLIRLLLLQALCAFFISSCQFIPVYLPTPQIINTINTEPPTIINTATTTPLVLETANPNSEKTPTASPIFSASATPKPTIILQPGSPAYIQNFVHVEEDCSWLGVAGQVFDKNGKPINNLVMNVKGTLGSDTLDKISITGIPEANFYGPGGYEIKISNKTMVSENTLSIQVLDLKGEKLSKAIGFNTYSDCKKNLIIINFQIK